MLNRDDRLSQTDSLADPEFDRSLDPLSRGEERSVGRTEVLKNEASALEAHLSVSPRDLWVLKGNVADIASHDDRFLVE